MNFLIIIESQILQFVQYKIVSWYFISRYVFSKEHTCFFTVVVDAFVFWDIQLKKKKKKKKKKDNSFIAIWVVPQAQIERFIFISV